MNIGDWDLLIIRKMTPYTSLSGSRDVLESWVEERVKSSIEHGVGLKHISVPVGPEDWVKKEFYPSIRLDVLKKIGISEKDFEDMDPDEDEDEVREKYDDIIQMLCFFEPSYRKIYSEMQRWSVCDGTKPCRSFLGIGDREKLPNMKYKLEMKERSENDYGNSISLGIKAEIPGRCVKVIRENIMVPENMSEALKDKATRKIETVVYVMKACQHLFPE